jgi:hypothetical protein
VVVQSGKIARDAFRRLVSVAASALGDAYALVRTHARARARAPLIARRALDILNYPELVSIVGGSVVRT